MSRYKQTNPSEKAKQSRMYRRNQRDQKRFEAPLREFIEIKYKYAFQEYVELYMLMDAQNPDKIDLKKTEMFKQWKILNQQSGSDILTVAIRETIGQDCNEAKQSEGNVSEAKQSEGNVSEAEQSEGNVSEDSEAEQREGNVSEDSEAEQSEGNVSEDSEAEQSEGNVSEDSEAEQSEGNVSEDSEAEQSETNEGLLAAQQVDALVNEMIIDDELRALLNVEEPEEPEVDEGIELNIFDEIDIEPFDFRLEVEQLGW